MKMYLALIVLLTFSFKAEAGGVISGGPLAQPADKFEEDMTGFPSLEDDMTAFPVMTMPRIVEVTDKEFREVARQAMTTGAANLYVNEELPNFSPQALDLRKKKITGINEMVEYIQIKPRSKSNLFPIAP